MKVLESLLFSVVVMAMSVNTQAAEWEHPSAKQCVDNGGEVKHGTLCYADWDSARSICAKAGVRLPTMEELGQVLEACGWDIEQIHKKRVDLDYTSCIEQIGFPIQRLYWSSFEYGDNGKESQMIHFRTGWFHSPKSYTNGVVCCVKDE